MGWLQSGSLSCQSIVWLPTELDDTKSSYQLIKTMSKFEKKTRHPLYSFIEKTVNLAKGKTMVHTNDVFCLLTQAWHVNCPFNCPITLSNYKCDLSTVLK